MSSQVNKQQQSMWEAKMKSASGPLAASCGVSRSRLHSLPVQPADIPVCYSDLTSAGYETSLCRQLVSSSASDDGTSPMSNQIDVLKIAQTLAQLGIAPQSSPLELSSMVQQNQQRPKSLLERSISMPAEPSSIGKYQLQIQQQQQQQQQAVNTSRYKTEMCRPFEEHGFCKYGEKCQFAHGAHELRSVNRHPKYKTELCRTFHTTGFCAYGSRCHFVHNEDERSSPPSQAQQQQQQRASPTLSIKTSPPPVIYSKSSSSATTIRNNGLHLPLMRCGSLGSTADSPPASPIDIGSSTPSFSHSNSNMSSPVNPPNQLNVLTLSDISSFLASLQGSASCTDSRRYTSLPSPPDSMIYGSDGCYDMVSSSASSSSAESSPTKCSMPLAFTGSSNTTSGRLHLGYGYYN